MTTCAAIARSTGARCRRKAVLGDFCARHGRTPEQLAYKFDRNKLQPVLDAIAACVPKQAAAAAAGVNIRTFGRWLERGREEIDDPDSPYAKFARDVETAEMRALQAAQGVLTSAMREGDTKAAQWWLERRHPELYGRKRAEDRGAPPEVDDLVDVSDLPPELARKLAAHIAGK